MVDDDTRSERAEQPAEPDDIEDTAEQDFAARNVLMSNALQGGASPVAGALGGPEDGLEMQPQTDEEELEAEGKLPPEEQSEEG
jgi:hypothetical protein